MFIRILGYIRGIVGIIIYPIFVMTLSLIGIVLNLLFSSRTIDNALYRFWGRTTCALFGVDVVVSGAENIPEGSCLYVFNHSSFFDIFVMAGWLVDFRFGSKIELFSIPFFGMAMKRFGVLPIARDQRNEVINVYKQASVRVKRGEKFALSPEGTRQLDEKLLANFKTGPFIFAIETGMPIVPVVIQNASKALPKGSWIPNVYSKEFRLKVSIQILPAVDVKNYTLDKRKELKNLIYTHMLSTGHFRSSKTSDS